tara:strand:- start:132 stop:554 length:423 start_codon:yes stop_codon:yes gene_type:complete
MADRNWNLLNSLGYLYNAFAVYTDGDLDEAEKKEMFTCISEWSPDSSRTEILDSLDSTLTWFLEDFKATDKENLMTDKDEVLGNIYGICAGIKENIEDEKTRQAIVDDLARIGRADGHYDDVEKSWAKITASNMGVNTPA